MEAEGVHNVIGIRGIERSAADLVAKDGGLQEVSGLIPRDGSLVPYGLTQADETHEGFNQFVRVHHTQTQNNVVYVNADNYFIVKEGTTAPFIHQDSKVVKGIVFIGNRMDIQTEDGIEHWLWKNGEYVNVGDLDGELYATENGVTRFALPNVEFKVRRGIYDGSKVYESARFVRVNDDFTDADTADADVDEIKKESQSKKYLLGDALAIIDSVRAIGGITGYVLVAAAWRRKGSSTTNPQYIMASPVMLMGTPEIYLKDGEFEETDFNYLEKRVYEQYGRKLNMFINADDIADPSAGALFMSLWNATPTDDRESEDLAIGENLDIEKEETNYCGIKTAVTIDDDPAWKFKGRKINQPALYQQRFAMYNHGENDLDLTPDAKYRSVTISHASANVLSVKVINSLDEKFKDEVDRLCIFISPIISPFEGVGDASISMQSTKTEDTPYDDYVYKLYERLRNSSTHYRNLMYGGSFLPEMKSESSVRDAVRNVSGLYKVKEYLLSEISDDWVDIDLSGKLESDKLIQHTDTMLKITDMQPVAIVTGNLFGYNERLHVYNFQKSEVYKLPYSSLQYHKDSGQYNDEIGESGDEWYTHGQKIITDGIFDWYQYIVKIVDGNDSTIVYTFRSKNPSLNPMVIHNDIEVKSITVSKRYVYVNQLTQLLKYYAGTVDYPIVEIAGICSGYVSADLKPFNIECVEVTAEEYAGLLPEEHISIDGKPYGKNEIRVSDVGTTLFEVKSSYKIGHGEIVGLARLAMSLSQDNFGKYPLVVFCTDGVYTLDVDTSGKTAYRVQSPLGRAICTNRNGICEIDGAVLFPTEQGLFVVTEEGVKPIALQARGKVTDYANSGLSLYIGAVSNAKLVQGGDAFSEEDFLEYINDEKCHIRYLSQLSMVVCYRRDRRYVYMLSVGDWSVWKLQKEIVTDDMDYPKSRFFVRDWASDGYTTKYTFDFESGEENTPCFFETRPIKLDTVHQKGVYRVVVRGKFGNTDAISDDGEYYGGLYVFGSYGGDKWVLLGRKEKMLTGFDDIGVETYRNGARLLKVVFVGKLSSDSHIDGLEITNEVRYNNKLK